MQLLSTVMMVFNEAENIERCIRSVMPFSDEILVVDSFSTDATVEIAKQLGAKVIQHPFEGYIEQKQYIIDQAKYDLVFTIDADEEATEGLQAEILSVKQSDQRHHYFVNRLNKIGSKWIQHGGWHPDWKLRLFYKNEVKVIGEQPHDEIIATVSKKSKKFKGKLLHYSDVGMNDRIRTLNQHSSSAANSLFKKGKKTNPAKILVKPMFRFFKEYIIKLGFLDGRWGYFIAKSNAQYVLWRELKLWELWKNMENE